MRYHNLLGVLCCLVATPCFATTAMLCSGVGQTPAFTIEFGSGLDVLAISIGEGDHQLRVGPASGVSHTGAYWRSPQRKIKQPLMIIQTPTKNELIELLIRDSNKRSVAIFRLAYSEKLDQFVGTYYLEGKKNWVKCSGIR